LLLLTAGLLLFTFRMQHSLREMPSWLGYTPGRPRSALDPISTPAIEDLIGS